MKPKSHLADNASNDDVLAYLKSWSADDEIACCFYEAFNKGAKWMTCYDEATDSFRPGGLLNLEKLITEGQEIFAVMENCRLKVDKPLDSSIINCICVIEEVLFRLIRKREKRYSVRKRAAA